MHDNACIATQIGSEKDDPDLPKDCRLGEWVNATTETRFVYTGPQLLGEYDIDGYTRQEIIWMGTMPVAILQGGEVYHVHTNQLSAPMAVTDNSAEVVWRWEPKPFGDSLADEDPDGDGQRFTFNLRFPGQYFDAETGLYYNYFRDYDPSVGRYVESDPIGLQGGLNTYTYGGGNPLSYVDPLGLLCGKGSHLLFDFRRGFSCQLDPPPPNPDARCITVECVMRNGDGRDTRKSPTCPIVCRVVAMPCQILGSIISPPGAACRGTIGVVCSAVCNEEKDECK
ncbi:RHS repeat domain-containing protein [Marinobacterium aestuarii]|uniref:RHS repeat domain-containing protein n=1 Tax=Marinobacterium aestuarii TaxID=1821621 RepID=UPI0009FDAAA3|nr:RHS repeat-associated core domain-containing protein [Marinobacterium aestuarii]